MQNNGKQCPILIILILNKINQFTLKKIKKAKKFFSWNITIASLSNSFTFICERNIEDGFQLIFK